MEEVVIVVSKKYIYIIARKNKIRCFKNCDIS